MIKGAIFDLDGTILDSMMIWNSVAENYLQSKGYKSNSELNNQVKNMSLSKAAHFVKKKYSMDITVDEIMNEINKMVEHYYRDVIQLKAGVFEFVKSLDDKGVEMCIATATDRYQVEMALKRCGIFDCFSRIFTCTEVGRGKVDPYIYRKALEHLKTPKEKTVVFEDALYAVKTAKTDGFIVAGVYDKFEKNKQEIKSLADVVIEDYNHTEDFWKMATTL